MMILKKTKRVENYERKIGKKIPKNQVDGTKTYAWRMPIELAEQLKSASRDQGQSATGFMQDCVKLGLIAHQAKKSGGKFLYEDAKGKLSEVVFE